MNILQKILVPLGAAFTVVLLVFIIVFKHYYDNMMNVTFESNITIKEVEFKSNTDKISEKALINSSFYSGLKTIKKAMSYYDISKNIDSSNAILREKYHQLSVDFKKNTGRKLNMAFYSKNGTNLYRSWDEQFGDDLISNNNLIDSVILLKKAGKTIGQDDWGINISGATPVFDIDSSFIGVVETRFPIGEILSNINQVKGEEIAILIKKNILRESNKLNLSLFSTVLKNNFYALKSSENFSLSYLENIKSSETFHAGDISGNFLYFSFPIKCYKNTIGYLVYQVDITPYIVNRNKVNWIVFDAGVISLIIVVLILLIIGRIIITKPTKKIIDAINNLSEGQIIDEIKIKTADEVSKIGLSVNKLSEAYHRFILFAKSIGEGEFDVEFNSSGEKDEMGNALLEMRAKLVLAKEEEKTRIQEEENRAWANKGLYELGEILRQNVDNIEELSHNVLTYIINYTDSNQGGIFLADDSNSANPIFELTAAYAYDRKKHMTKSIPLGEGLVGTCAIEKETIYMDDIPDNYVNITSGLGKSNPRSILLVPLKVKDRIYGVLELASFNKYNDFKIKFLEDAADSIASSFSISKINMITSELLEHSQQQQEEMRAQEEEMRQNMEELQTTQEEVLRRENEMNGILKALNDSSLVIMLNTDLNIISINDKFSSLIGVSLDRIEGRKIEDILQITTEDINNLNSKLNNGETVRLESKIELTDNKELWLRQLYYPILDDEDVLIKIINICEDMTTENKLNKYIKNQKQEF
jgi:putative methionine-R-sulfoxide reductase with GAF domain/HAMP domain-containing protein